MGTQSQRLIKMFLFYNPLRAFKKSEYNPEKNSLKIFFL